jgi:aminodeoxyfutalosine synthase
MEAVNALDAVAERVRRGDALSETDARAILGTHDIIEVGALADGVRRQRHGKRTTFVRVLEIHVEAPPASLPSRLSAGELRIVGTPRDEASAVAAVRATAALAGGVPVTGFALNDLAALAPSSGDLQGLCRRLCEAGLQAVAELALDSLAHGAGSAAVRAARDAGLQVLRVTVHSMADNDRLLVLQRARALQADVGGFKAFAPLPRAMPADAPTTGYDDVKVVALARLLVDNVESILVDWPLYGPKLAQVALTMGADDVDGIAAADPGVLGTRRSALEEILGNIRAAGLEPMERDGLFRHECPRTPEP